MRLNHQQILNQIRQSYRHQARESLNRNRKAHSRNQFIASLTNSNLNQQMHYLKIAKPAEISSVLEQLTKMINQCSLEVQITKENIQSLVIAINRYNQGWKFLQILCQKLLHPNIDHLIKSNIIQLIREIFVEPELNVLHAQSAIKIIGCLSVFQINIITPQILTSFLSASLNYQKYLLKSWCFFLQKVSDVNVGESETLNSFLIQNITHIVEIINQEHIDMGSLCEAYVNIIKKCNNQIIARLIQNQFLQRFIEIIRQKRRIETTIESKGIIRVITTFYSVIIMNYKIHYEYILNNIKSLLKWFVAISNDYSKDPLIRVEVFSFYTFLSQNPTFHVVLRDFEIVKQLIKHLQYSSKIYCRYQESNPQKNPLFEILFFFELYYKEFNAGNLIGDITQIGLLEKIEYILMNNCNFQLFIVGRVLKLLQRISIQEEQIRNRIIVMIENSGVRESQDPVFNYKIEQLLKSIKN